MARRRVRGSRGSRHTADRELGVLVAGAEDEFNARLAIDVARFETGYSPTGADAACAQPTRR
jgi:hypothetical protein